MIVLIGGEKGGTGKSTLATNLAVCLAHRGRDVLLLDCDPQRSSASWVGVRSANAPDAHKIHCMEKLGDVLDAVRDVSARYADVIIDAGGRDSRELRSAMLAADTMYVPIKASQFDLWTVERMNELIDQAKSFNRELRASALLSMAPTNPQINEAAEAEEMLREYEHLDLARTVIRERKAFRDAIVLGNGVIELDPAKALKAAAEMEALAQEVTGEQVLTHAAQA